MSHLGLVAIRKNLIFSVLRKRQTPSWHRFWAIDVFSLRLTTLFSMWFYDTAILESGVNRPPFIWKWYWEPMAILSLIDISVVRHTRVAHIYWKRYTCAELNLKSRINEPYCDADFVSNFQEKVCGLFLKGYGGGIWQSVFSEIIYRDHHFTMLPCQSLVDTRWNAVKSKDCRVFSMVVVERYV